MNKATRAAKFKVSKSHNCCEQDKEQRPLNRLQNHNDAALKSHDRMPPEQKPLVSTINTIEMNTGNQIHIRNTQLGKPFTSYKDLSIEKKFQDKRKNYVNILSKAQYRFSLRHQSFIRSVLILDKYIEACGYQQIHLGTLFACFFLAAKTQQIYLNAFEKYAYFFKFEQGLSKYFKYEIQVLQTIKFDVNWKDGPYYHFFEYKDFHSLPKHVKFYIQYLLEIICLNSSIYKEFSWKVIVNTIHGYLESPLIPNQKFNTKNQACLTKILLALKASIKKDYVYAKYCGISYQSIAIRPVPRLEQIHVKTFLDQQTAQEKKYQKNTKTEW